MLARLASFALSFALIGIADSKLPVSEGEAVLMEQTAGDGSAVAPPELTLHARVEEVQVTLTARDREGRPVLDLEPSNLLVQDEGYAIGDITRFARQEELRLRLAVLMDISDSMQWGLKAEQQAGLALVRSLRPSDTAEVAGFSTRMQTAAGGAPGLRPASFSRWQAQSETALFDAVYQVAKSLARDPPQPDERRLMVLLSDGEDNLSRRTLEEAIAMCQQADAALYALTSHDRHVRTRGDRVLSMLAEATGGRAFLVESFDEVSGIFERILREARSQYLVGYRPRTRRRGRHQVEILLNRRENVELRYRKGYYLEP